MIEKSPTRIFPRKAFYIASTSHKLFLAYRYGADEYGDEELATKQ